MHLPRKRVTILGSTGSIGRNALSVVENLDKMFEVVGLAANHRWQDLAEQAARFQPRAVGIADAEFEEPLTRRLNDLGVRCAVFAGADALVRLVSDVPTDFVLAAVVGAAGLPSTVAAVERGLTVGLANKEALVVAGSLIAPLAEQTGATLIPVDSEHSAVFQAMHAGHPSEVERVYLTASGGPFRTWSRKQIERATLEDALKHPTWSMGPKITIDSATMMNKALEIIEAKWLFHLDPDQIEVLIHPESIIHSIVLFHDGSLIAQLGAPDMRTPIQYAMTYPHRVAGCCDRLDLAAIRRMHFEPPDHDRFPALRLGHEVARTCGTTGAALNAANEAAVEAFRRGRLRFHEIVSRVEDVLRRHTNDRRPDLSRLLAVDEWARQEVLGSCCTV
jgi:1-deoxy-D-xylulose-5-phosphate reductoisomerase